MHNLKAKYKDLCDVMQDDIDFLIRKRGIDTGHAIEKGLKVKGEYYVEGRLITHITGKVLCADGLHYDHHCLHIEELIELVESL